MKKVLLSLFVLSVFTPCVLADKYVPEFNKMKYMRCDVVETTFDSNEKEISTTGYHRNFRLDDENNLLYLEKNLVDGLMQYDNNILKFHDEYMTDDAIVRVLVEIDRNQMKYTSSSYIQYDNPDFGTQEAVGVGECKILQ